jgi:hypothetical protein
MSSTSSAVNDGQNEAAAVTDEGEAMARAVDNDDDDDDDDDDEVPTIQGKRRKTSNKVHVPLYDHFTRLPTLTSTVPT